MYKLVTILFITLTVACNSTTKKQINEQKFGKINKSELGQLDHDILLEDETKKTIPVSLNNKPIDISSIIDSIKLIPLETTENSLIGNIDKISYSNGQYYILDKHKSKNLYVFDTQGKYLNSIGKAGRGPGEYIEPSDFIVYPYRNEIVIFDHFGRQLLYYTLDGTFKNNVRLQYIITEIIPTPNDTIFLAKTGDNRHIEEINGYELLSLNREGKIISKMLKHDKRLNFINEFDYQYTDSAVLYHQVFSDKILSIKKDQISLDYQFNIPEGLPQNFENRCNGNYNNFMKLFKKQYNYPSNKFFETDRYLFLSLVSKAGNTVHFYYNKTNGEILSGIPAIQFGSERGFDLPGIISFSLINSFTVSQNQVIGHILSTYLDLMPEKDRKKWLPQSNSGESDSNPVLFKLKLK